MVELGCFRGWYFGLPALTGCLLGWTGSFLALVACLLLERYCLLAVPFVAYIAFCAANLVQYCPLLCLLSSILFGVLLMLLYFWLTLLGCCWCCCVSVCVLLGIANAIVFLAYIRFWCRLCWRFLLNYFLGIEAFCLFRCIFTLFLFLLLILIIFPRRLLLRCY